MLRKRGICPCHALQVNFSTLVYKVDKKTFLVIAAEVSSGGAMAHTVDHTKGLCCGYYQVCTNVVCLLGVSVPG